MRIIKFKEKFIQNLSQQPGTPEHKRAKFLLIINQEIKNLINLAKWMIINLILLIPPYLGWGYHQMLISQTVQMKDINTQTLWAVQENLQLTSAITGSLLLFSLFLIYKHGLYHRQYNKETLTAQIKQLTNKKGK